MNARDFMEMNKRRALRGLEENRDRPRSQAYVIDKAILNFITAYEMEVGYERDRSNIGFWENIPINGDFQYQCVNNDGWRTVMRDIGKENEVAAGTEMWKKSDIVELRIRRRNDKS